MRNIYNNRIINTLEQGSIINYCFARNYPNSETFGIIITPRCDITNHKVSTVHYLPIVGLTDWIYNDFWLIFSARALGELKGKIKNLLEKYKLSYSIVEMFSIDALCNILNDKINKKNDFDDFKKILSKIQICKLPSEKLNIKTKKEMIREMPKISLAIFKELRDNRFKEFYLLEKWNSDKDYAVVLMREIGSIKWELAHHFSRGIYGKSLAEDLKDLNSVAKIEEDSFLQTQATLKSPFIEHLIQHFFLNFGRIGIEDHECVENDFHNSIINQ